MKETQYLYHLTTKNELSSIMKNGLEPRIGANSKIVQEKTPRIYLSDKNSIPFWSVLLNKKLILRINIRGLNINDEYNYTKYKEFIYEHKITPDRITICDNPPSVTTQHMQELCKSYMHIISYCTTACADYYTRPKWLGYSEEDMDWELENLIQILPRLNFKSLSEYDIKQELIHMGQEQCMITFVDTYFNTERRMYEQLIYYPNDKLTHKRQQLYNMIKSIFHNCLNVETGGYCW